MVTILPADEEEIITRILASSRVIAVVGLSPKSDRPSYQVAGYLMAAGYSVIPVNPGRSEILGEPCYPDLLSIPQPVDVVDIFRRPEYVPLIVEQAIRIGAKAVWMQVGIVHEAAAVQARAAGLAVVMNRCLKDEHLSRRQGVPLGRWPR